MQFKYNILLMLMFVGYIFATESGPVYIDRIEIEFEGKARTKESALRNTIDLHEGDEFESLKSLDNALQDIERKLKNTRYFQSVEITKVKNHNAYDIIITVKDGWTFVPIPYPLPDSSIGRNGWSFGAEINYDNMFGTMKDFYFDGYANIAFGEERKLKSWRLTPKMKKIAIGPLKYDISFKQQYGTIEVTDPSRTDGEQLLQHYTNNETFLQVGTKLMLTDQLSYSITPEVGLKYLYDYHDSFEGDAVMENNTVIEDRINVVFNHSIGIGQVDWLGPLREGYGISLEHSLKFLSSYDNSTDIEEFRFVTSLNPSIKYYKTMGSRLNYYTRFQGLYIYNNKDNGLGSRLRGVKNSSMSGDVGVFWQNSLAIEVVGNNTFHFQMHPFIDTGVVFDSSTENSFTDQFRYGFGTDIIIMLGSIDIRGKIGYDPISEYVDFSFATGLSY